MTAPITTIEFPVDLPVQKKGDHWVARSGDVELRLTNLTKVFWPETGYTKGDLLTYYFNLAPTILPHVSERPLTLKRMPDGVVGPYFYEKDAPAYTPDWMPRLHIRTETDDRTIGFATITDIASLLWVVNLGCIELHTMHGRGSQQKRPSYALFDLDPFEPASFDDARRVALHVKLLLDQLALDSYPKTSGATGIQVFVPLDGTHSYDVVRKVVTKMCRMINSADPEGTTLEWDTAKRVGKVFLDANMNRAGASIAAPYSVRPRWEAPVSAPVTWDELDSVAPQDFTMANMASRVSEIGDPFAPVALPGGRSLDTVISTLGVV